MKNQNTNEESLLTFLEELKEQTISSITKEVETRDYWVSGRYQKDVDSGHVNRPTNGQVDFYITNCKNRLKPLNFRLDWIKLQIENVKFSQKFETIRK